MNPTESYVNELLRQLVPSNQWEVHVGSSGMNNTTRFIEANGRKYVMRIYETHRDALKVEYEHHALLALKDITLPFHIPQPVQTPEGQTFIRGNDGKIAALFYFLDGTNPALEEPVQLHSFGEAAGRLTRALQLIPINHEPVYKPYYEIEHTHPRCSLHDVIHFCTSPPLEFKAYASSLVEIGNQLAALQESIPMLKQLPHQLVHGDLNASNILVNEEGYVSAVLDFEFITQDLRVMELAVCLSDIMSAVLKEELLWIRIDSFLTGYGSAAKLSLDEIHVIPLLIQLRRLDVFIHFLGRYWDKIDNIDIVKDQIGKTVSKTTWLTAHKEKLIQMCIERVLKD